MIRANPGVMLLKDGTVAGKWNVESMPHVGYLDGADEGLADALAGDSCYMRNWKSWILIMLSVILLIVVIDLLTKEKRKTTKENTDESISDINNINPKN